MMKKFGIMFGMIAVAALLVAAVADAATVTNRLGQVITTSVTDDGVTTTAFSLPNDPTAPKEHSHDAVRIVPLETNLVADVVTWNVLDPFQELYLVDAGPSVTNAFVTIQNTDTNLLIQPYAYEITFVNVGSTGTMTFVDGSGSGPLELSGNAVLEPWDTLTLRKVASNRWVEAEQVDNSD